MYALKVLIAALTGAFVYFGLRLCGMSVTPWGYLGAAIVSVAVMHWVWLLIKSAGDKEL